MAEKQTAIGKRQKIAQSNRTMFMWIAGMSAVIGVCLVLVWFLFQQLIFHTRIAAEEDKTVSTLNKNIETVAKLRDNIRLLEVDPSLNSIKSDSDAKALQVVLDALPADANDLALGASIQDKLIGPVKSVVINSLTVGDQLNVDAAPVSVAEGVEVIPFSVIMTSNDPNALKDVLLNFERSIRTLDIDNFLLDRSDESYKLTITAHAYYKPATVAELKDKVIKPNEKK